MRKNISFISKLLLSIFLLSIVSCEMRDELRNRIPGGTNEEAVGGFSLDLLSKENATRSGDVVDQYTVQIVKVNGEVVSEYASYLQLQGDNSIIQLPVGRYKVRSASYAGEEEEARMDKAYYFSEKDFEVNAGEVTSLKDTCKQSSVTVNVGYDDSFLNEVEDNYAVTITNGLGVLTMNKDVNGVAYFRVSPTMIIAVRATTKNGTEVYKSQVMSSKDGSPLKPEDKFDINLGIKDTIPANPGIPENPDNPGEPGNPEDPNNPGGGHFDITIDVTLNGKDVDIVIPAPEVPKPDPDPNPNPDPSPDPDPDPNPGPDPGPSYAAPTIVGKGFNIDQALVNPTTVQVNITAEAGIENLVVTIESAPLNGGLLDELGLGNSFDLAHPGNKEPILTELGLPVGSAVLGQTAVLFDVSEFMGILEALQEPGPHNFHLKVKDKQGKELSKTLSINFTF